jgi:NNP family nitrate/nitrite transporter-like MFS transporter
MVPVAIVWVLFAVMAKDAPRKAPPKGLSDYKQALKMGDTGWFCFLYSLTFGGFSGLVSVLTIFFFDQYHLTKVQAGDLTTLVVVFGSFLRPVGGMLSDRVGGYRMLRALLAGAAICLGALATLPTVTLAVLLLVMTMGLLGMGNGAVFQLVPQRFPERVGLITGLVGAAGGVGGFLLPNVLGGMKQATGSFGPGLAVCAIAIAAGSCAMFVLGRVWRATWKRESALRAGLIREEHEVPASQAA